MIDKPTGKFQKNEKRIMPKAYRGSKARYYVKVAINLSRLKAMKTKKKAREKLIALCKKGWPGFTAQEKKGSSFFIAAIIKKRLTPYKSAPMVRRVLQELLDENLIRTPY